MSATHWLGPYKNADDALNELRKSVAELIGADPDTWPDNGNAPLAIAATLALARRAAAHPGVRVKKLEWRDEEPGISTLYTRIADSIVGRYAVTPINGAAYLNGKLIISDESAEAAAQADYERRSLSTLEPSSTTPPFRPTHRHVKRGSEYRVIGEAEAQVSTGVCVPFFEEGGARNLSNDWWERDVKDGDRLTVYQGADGKLWARFSDEFNDGRFVAIEAEA